MPRYFFHIADSILIPDEDGTVLESLDAARVEAISVAAGMLRDHAADFWRSGEWRVIVTGEDHLILFTVSCQALAAPVPPKRFDPLEKRRLVEALVSDG